MKFFDAEEYQLLCQALFSEYQRKILAVLPQARIEHIGASSIPNAVSKGDLDIFVGVDKPSLEASVTALKSLGCEEKQDTLRTGELCMLESVNDDDVAIQVVANGSQFEFFLAFRDALRQSPKLVAQYNQLKHDCKGMGMDDYRAQKAVFVERVLQDWVR